MKKALAILLLLSATACDPYLARRDRDDHRRRDDREQRDQDERRDTDRTRTPGGYR